MSESKKSTPAEDLIASLLKEIGGAIDQSSDEQIQDSDGDILGLIDESKNTKQHLINTEEGFDLTQEAYEGTRNVTQIDDQVLTIFDDLEPLPAPVNQLKEEVIFEKTELKVVEEEANVNFNFSNEFVTPIDASANESTVALDGHQSPHNDGKKFELSNGDSERTVAVTGFQIKNDLYYDDKIKVSVGQNRTTAYSTGYAAWGTGSDSNLAQAENLRMAQDKILDLERENEQLRQQNEQLISASEIIKERSDLLAAQVTEFQNDRQGLEDSFKNEMTLLKNHLVRKDAELQRAQFKVDELESRLKFDMKKIRIRERELENRLELVRAEKNAIVKNKDEQILDLRRKMDIVQMEVDSYRQKCVELNKLVEINQESFKRTTRALRLAMANLELQDENKVSLKKVD